jgi:hypothetical protein
MTLPDALAIVLYMLSDSREQQFRGAELDLGKGAREQVSEYARLALFAEMRRLHAGAMLIKEPTKCRRGSAPPLLSAAAIGDVGVVPGTLGG